MTGSAMRRNIAERLGTDNARWLGRLCPETQVSLRQAQLLAVSLAGLPDRAAATALAAGCADLGLARAAAAARAAYGIAER